MSKCSPLLLAILALAAGRPVNAADKNLSHAPVRPLPVARTQPLTKGPAFYADSTKGDDAADGSKEKPWKTIQHGLNRLKPGETLYARGGVYYEKVRLVRSGTEGVPITVASYPGELAVIDGGLEEFAKSPETSWEPVRDGPKDEYISSKTYPNADSRAMPQQFLPASWEPMLGVEDERPLALGNFIDSMLPLHGYRSLSDLRSDNEYHLVDKSNVHGAPTYCGPGLWFDRETQRIHIRLAHSHLPGLGDAAYQGETDPRKLKLVVAAGFGDVVLRANGVKYVNVEGLVLRGATGSPMTEIYGSENVHFDHLTVFGGFPGLLVNASKNIVVSNCAFRGLAAPWSGRSQMKYFGTASYVVVFQNFQPENENIELSWNEFTDGHDFGFFRYVKNFQFHHNLVDNFNDDGIEIGPKRRSHSMYIYQNRIGPCLGVFQQHEGEKDESPIDHDKSSGAYVYRNVIDQRAGVEYTLPKKADPTGNYLHVEGHILSDHGNPIYTVMKVYYNTIIRHEPVARNHFLFGLANGLRATERDVFNNILVQLDGLPGAVFYGKEGGPLREGGNLLWGVQEGPKNTADLFAKFRATPQFAESRKSYEPGWSTQDKVADPKFASLPATGFGSADFRLLPGSPAIGAGLPVPAEWPDPLRGADQGAPDIGALPHGTEPWTVGVDGRISLFEGTPK